MNYEDLCEAMDRRGLILELHSRPPRKNPMGTRVGTLTALTVRKGKTHVASVPWAGADASAEALSYKLEAM